MYPDNESGEPAANTRTSIKQKVGAVPKYALTPDRTALIVVDMSRDFLDATSPVAIASGRAMLPRVADLIWRCRSAGVWVVYLTVAWDRNPGAVGRMADVCPAFVSHDGLPRVCVAGTPGVEIVDEITPAPEDALLVKQRFGGFTGTGLHEMLSTRDIDTVIIIGVAANGCCESTAREAVNLDYKVVFVSDCTATGDLPDMGWGGVTEAESMRVLLTEMAFATGEVLTADQVLRRLAAEGSAADDAGSPTTSTLA
jgi:nicotinamidase-related amidase